MNPFVADPHWGWWIVFYFYLGGLAAGAYFVATLVALFGREEDRAVSRLGYRLAFPLIGVCGVLLILDLDRPERFWHMLLQSEVVYQALDEGWPLGGWGTMLAAPMLKWWSPMSIGSWALSLFGLCSALSFLGTFSDRAERWLSQGIVGRALQIVGTLVGFFVASYTGVLLTATNQPLWSLSDWIGPLFLTSAASTGIAALLLLGRGHEATRERLERADLWALGVELFVFLIFLASLGPLLPLTILTVPGAVLVLGTLTLGLLVPVGLHLRISTAKPGAATAAALFALVGGFALRYGIVRAAPALLAVLNDTPADPRPLWLTWAGSGLLATTLVLAIAIPLVLRRQWRLSRGGTALAGLASLLVVLAVGYYSTSPTAHPRLVTISPEDGRERGGGVGASASNRPETFRLRSKLAKVAPDEP